MIVIGTPKIWYGIRDDKPELPLGWSYEEAAGKWLLAVSPDGRKWFVTDEGFYRAKFATLWDVIRTLPNYLRGWRPFRYGQMYFSSEKYSLKPIRPWPSPPEPPTSGTRATGGYQ